MARIQRMTLMVLFLSLGMACSLFSPRSLVTPTQTITTTGRFYPTSTPLLIPLTASVTLITPTQTPSRFPQPFSTLTGEPVIPPTAPVPTLDPLICLPDEELPEFGIVRWVKDSNTLVVEIAGRYFSVRFLGIEVSSSEMSTVRELLSGKVVRLIRDVADIDRFGQLLRFVLLPEGRFINYELVRHGAAKVVDDELDSACLTAFLQAEQLARQENLGIWAALALLPGTPSTGTIFPTLESTLPATGMMGPSPTITSPSPTAQFTRPLTPIVTTAPQRTPTITAKGNVVITYIRYQGNPPREADEYAEFTNRGNLPVNLYGWQIYALDIDFGYTFPEFMLMPGQVCRIYTNEDHEEYCGFKFGSPIPIWNNEGDCGYFLDWNSEEVAGYCY